MPKRIYLPGTCSVRKLAENRDLMSMPVPPQRRRDDFYDYLEVLGQGPVVGDRQEWMYARFEPVGAGDHCPELEQVELPPVHTAPCLPMGLAYLS